jgi:hypothetical protein
MSGCRNSGELLFELDLEAAVIGAALAAEDHPMITLEDCVGLCGLTEEEVLAIAEHEHEHVTEIAAAAIGRYLLKAPQGAEKIRDMMRDDIHAAFTRDDREHASELLMVLRHFLETHPEAQALRPLH